MTRRPENEFYDYRHYDRDFDLPPLPKVSGKVIATGLAVVAVNVVLWLFIIAAIAIALKWALA